jgi:LysR family transcriptional activator of glutamate synthase operon
MNLEYFHEFLTLADTRNYLQAADQLALSQSTLSRHINAMEEELGTPLFERTTRRVRLTKAGEALQPFAASIVSTQHEYAAALQPFAKKSAEPVRVGTVPMMPYYGISEVLFQYRSTYPDFPLHVEENAAEALYEKLRTRKCDYAFVLEGGHPNPEFARMPFLSDEMVVMLPSDHPLCAKSRLRLEQLKGETFLTLSDYTVAYQLAAKTLSALMPAPKMTCCGVRMEGVANRVAEKEGVCLAMKQAALFSPHPGVTLVELAPRIPVNVNLVFCRGRIASPSAQHFIDYVSRSRPR